MRKELNIFGDIVSLIENKGEISPLLVKSEIDGLTEADSLVVNIDCYGGEVFAAVAISSIIHNSPAKKTFNILGICASAATMLFNDSDLVNIASGAMVMYHKPMVGASGNASELKKQIDQLDKIESENIIKPLINRTGKTASHLMDLIEGEWWLTSSEAILELGFVGLDSFAVMNSLITKQKTIYKNYIEKRKALKVDAFKQFNNFKKQLKK